MSRFLLPVAAIFVSAGLLAGCADPKKTAARGADELARHRADPFLNPGYPLTPPTLVEDVAAFVPNGILDLRIARPTTFRRTYATSDTPRETFAAYDQALVAKGATYVSTACSVVERREIRTYEATSLGDPVRVSVSITPKLTNPIEYSLAIESPERTRSTGLSNCLDVVLKPAAFVAQFSANRPLSEACAMVTDDILRLAFGGSLGEQPAKNQCSFQAKVNGERIYLSVLDERTQSTAQLLDRGVPNTDPDASVFAAQFGGRPSAILPKFSSGAVQVASNSQSVVDVVANALLANDAVA
jgi:hypothetical protein